MELLSWENYFRIGCAVPICDVRSKVTTLLGLVVAQLAAKVSDSLNTITLYYSVVISHRESTRLGANAITSHLGTRSPNMLILARSPPTLKRRSHQRVIIVGDLGTLAC